MKKCQGWKRFCPWHFEKKGWNSFGKIGFQTETHDHEKYFKGRSSGVPAGRFHPGIFCCNHDFCKPARTDRCGSSWNCGEDHQYFIPCSIVYDVYNLSTCGAEYRSGKTRPCKADIKICADDYGDIWINYDDYRTVCVSSAGRIIYKWWCSCSKWSRISSQLCVRLHFRRNSFLPEWIFLCIWSVSDFVHS